ncbi:MAG: DUF2470 domain-containing protein [Bacteroidota bacterium]
MANNTFENKKFINYAVNHVNEDHRKEMIQLVQVFTDYEAVSDVTLLDYDAEGMEVIIVEREKGEQRTRIPFPEALKGPHDFRPVLVDMVKTAREKIGK